MSDRVEDFRRSYASALERYLRDPTEDALHSGYQLGREAVRQDLSVLDLASIHHDVLLATLSPTSAASEAATVVPRARTFFVESLSAYEMVQRGFREAHEAALVEKRNAAILRQLSNFLADASLALNATESLIEMLQLVAEQARELIGAECAVARVVVDGGEERAIDALSHSEADPTWSEFVAEADLGSLASLIPSADKSLRIGEADFGRYPTWRAATERSPRRLRGWLGASLAAWDDRHLGFIQLFDKSEGDFSDVDEAVLAHLAQMASAAIERTELYQRSGARRGAS